MKKRQVKAPKVYLRDSGILHSLLSITDRHSLVGHPKVGASWEGAALEQALQLLRPAQAFFWGTHGGAELDLLFLHRGRRYGLEFKFTEAPAMTKSMGSALEDLKLEHLWVVYPGEHRFPIDRKVSAWPFRIFPHYPGSRFSTSPPSRQTSRRRNSWISFEKAGREAANRGRLLTGLGCKKRPGIFIKSLRTLRRRFRVNSMKQTSLLDSISSIPTPHEVRLVMTLF